jgi:hypothetical protein
MTRLSRFVAFAACLMMTGVVAEAHAPARLRVRLVPQTREPRDQMGGQAWVELIKECQRIWRAEQVEVIGEGDKTAADVSIPLVFDHLQLLEHDSPKGTALGVTLFRGLTRKILVSVPRARQAAYRDASLGASGVASAGGLDTAMARILGRVVAHEVGHVLLLKAGHGTTGLMRPDVDIRDLRTGAEGQFALSPGERAWLATRFPRRYPQPPAEAVTGSPGRHEPAVTSARATVTVEASSSNQVRMTPFPD